MNTQPILDSIDNLIIGICAKIEEEGRDFNPAHSTYLWGCFEVLKKTLEFREEMGKWNGVPGYTPPDGIFLRAAEIALEGATGDDKAFFEKVIETIKQKKLEKYLESERQRAQEIIDTPLISHVGAGEETASGIRISEKAKPSGIEVDDETYKQIQRRAADRMKSADEKMWEADAAEGVKKMGLGDPDFGKTAEFVDMRGVRQDAVIGDTKWRIKYNETFNTFYIHVSGDNTVENVTPHEVHHLIADLQKALAEYAKEEVFYCDACNEKLIFSKIVDQEIRLRDHTF